VLSLTTPPECHDASVSLRRAMLPSPRSRGLGLRSYILSRPPLGSLALRPGDSLAILTMALSVGFIRFVSFTNATQVTGLLTLAPMGLTPIEHASLRWTHCFANIRDDSNSLYLQHSQTVPHASMTQFERYVLAAGPTTPSILFDGSLVWISYSDVAKPGTRQL
jgi:hypothetical protein